MSTSHISPPSLLNNACNVRAPCNNDRNKDNHHPHPQLLTMLPAQPLISTPQMLTTTTMITKPPPTTKATKTTDNTTTPLPTGYPNGPPKNGSTTLYKYSTNATNPLPPPYTLPNSSTTTGPPRSRRNQYARTSHSSTSFLT